MIKSLFVFAGTFAAGALAALVVRAALFSPEADATAAATHGGDYVPMVTNAAATGEHAGHGHGTPAAASPADVAAPSSGQPVNTVCAICGMDVDPRLPTAEYQGKVIGFGCRMCPPKFKAEPDRYGPVYLKNEVVKR